MSTDVEPRPEVENPPPAVVFNMTLPQVSGTNLTINLAAGRALFVLGANGSGKSGMMQYLFAQHAATARRISAHRQTWFQEGASSMTAAARVNVESYIRNSDAAAASRWRDDYPLDRANRAIFDLIDAENRRARSIAAAVDAADDAQTKQLAREDGTVKTINELFRQSSIPIVLSIDEDSRIVASKRGGKPYSIAELSDGERNALLLAIDVLTAKKNTLLLVDEPERHLHRSIICPLLALLFKQRKDCAFVVSTHDVGLPLHYSDAQMLLVRDCRYEGAQIAAWDVDELASGTVDETLCRDVLGARRHLLFIEGEAHSLDSPLYNLIFPDVSIIAKGSCRDVEHAVSGLREASDLHWLRAWGLIDDDRRTEEEREKLKRKGIHALPIFSVESIFYHPEIQKRVALRHAKVTGGDAQDRLNRARQAAVEAVHQHVTRMASRVIEKRLRAQIMSHLPKQQDIANGATISVAIDVPAEMRSEEQALRDLLADRNVLGVISRYPVRETPALGAIAKSLGFTDREQYESAVLKLVMDDSEALTFVRSLFAALYQELTA